MAKALSRFVSPSYSGVNCEFAMDRYCKQDGKWLFAERRYHVLYQGAADYSAKHQPYPS